MLFRQQLDDYKQKVTDEKQVHQEDLEKSIEILKEQGIWDNEILFSKDYKEYLDLQEAFQLRLHELLKKVEKEKDLASFREELEKLGEKSKKDIDAFVDLGQRIIEEAKKPVPFFATWIGLVISVITCSIVSFFILNFYKKKQKEEYQEKLKTIEGLNERNAKTNKEFFGKDNNMNENDNKEIQVEKENTQKNCLDDYCLVMALLFVIHSFLQFLIVPLINCLLSLKISFFKEIHKHYFINALKLLFLCLSFFVTTILFANKLVYDQFFLCKKLNDPEQ